MKLEELIQAIQVTHRQCQEQALQQVNHAMTLRNWAIGFYIFEFEQKGENRAAFGSRLIPRLAESLGSLGIGATTLKLCRQFYLTYPQLGQAVSDAFQVLSQAVSDAFQVLSQTASDQLEITEDQGANSITKTLPPTRFPSKPVPHPQEKNPEADNLSFPPQMLLSRLSFSHFIELIKADSPIKRAFYEVEAIRNHWSVRELKRSMETLLFERTGMSNNKEAVISKAKGGNRPNPAELIRNPYILEFLAMPDKAEFSESDLEQAIINHLQIFLMEMGRGFCFEARQKRITFDNVHYRIDLVFYHRILKCHVLVDLKIGAFDHADAGQMNLYLNYYAENEKADGDNPPVGIILCAEKNDAMVKYATGGLSQEVFVGKYLVQLPTETQLKALIESERQAFLDKGGKE